MNATVDLTRARLVEFDTLYKGGTVSLLVSRRQSSNAFTPLGVNGEPPTEDWGIWRTHDIVSSGTNIRILAEFPLTLADLIPEDCQAFRFKHNGLTDTAVFDMVFKAWEVTGHDGCHATLESLAEHFDIELDTVVPLTLTTHSDYVEGRR